MKIRCCKYGKELKLKANHNQFFSLILGHRVVANMGKNWNWKQITTKAVSKQQDFPLLQRWERTEIESKSQQGLNRLDRFISCCKDGKELKLKANHNSLKILRQTSFVVAKMGKNWNWKQITTGSGFGLLGTKLLQRWERTEIESKSQPKSLLPNLLLCCCKDGKELKLKANHNCGRAVISFSWVVAKMGKNWNWKQITTPFYEVCQILRLLQIWERTEIESKSQHQQCWF